MDISYEWNHVIGGLLHLVPFISVQLLSYFQLIVTPWTAAHQASLSITNSQNLSHDAIWWCHPTISSSVVPFFSCLQSCPALGSFPGKSVLCIRWPKYWGFSFSISPSLPVNIQGWFLLGLTGLISLLPKGLSSVFSNTTVRRHQLFSAKCFLLSSSHICTWPLEKP